MAPAPTMVIRTFLLPRVCTLDADAQRELVILSTSRFLRLLSHDAAASVSAVRGGKKPGQALRPCSRLSETGIGV